MTACCWAAPSGHALNATLTSMQASLFFSTGELTLGYSAVTSATAISQVPPGL